MIRDEIEAVETTSPDNLVEQTEQLKLIFSQVFSVGNLILIQPNANSGNGLGK